MSTEQFAGHTPGPWMPRDINDGALPHNEADLDLMAAAPDLLAEVKRLRRLCNGLAEETTRLNQYIALLHETLEEEHFVLSKEFNAKAETIFPDVEGV